MVEYDMMRQSGGSRSEVHFGSSTDMSEVSDEDVELIVTSPPYNIDWDYGSYEDSSSIQEYKELLEGVIDESYRVLCEQGRFCINVPDLTRISGGDGISQMKIVMNIMRESDDDWNFREVIIWNKKAGKPPKHSTFPEPWGVLLNNVHEAILVAQKGGRRRGYERPDGDIREDSKYRNPPSDVQTDVWDIPVQQSYKSVDGEKVPSFPEELPKRLIKLYSYKTDTVLDPFAGSGTTLKVANSLGRNAVGYELREEMGSIINENLKSV